MWVGTIDWTRCSVRIRRFNVTPFHVKITAKDITDGGDCYDNCPASTAISRTLGRKVAVGVSHFWPLTDDGHRAPIGETRLLPLKVIEWIKGYDQLRRRMAPISFHILAPESWAQHKECYESERNTITFSDARRNFSIFPNGSN